ncbi:MAG: M23 family metallopeptidase [Patescibacteria group bacterium]
MNDTAKPLSLFWIILAGLTIISTLVGIPWLFVFAPTAGSILNYINISDDKRLSQHQPTGTTSTTINLNFPTSTTINISLPEMGNCLDEYIKSQVGEAGLYGQGETIATAGEESNVNPAFIVAIAQAESALGTRITKGTFNYWNFLPPPDYRYDFSNWEISIHDHTQFLKAYLDRGQNTFTTIGNGSGGTYVPSDTTKYSPNNCELAVVGSLAYAPCGVRTTTDADGNVIITKYGTPDAEHDPTGVNANWIPNVTYFFDQIAAQCNYLSPRPTGYQWCHPTDATIITATFLDPEYKRILGYDHYGIDFAPASSDEKQVYATSEGIVTEVYNSCPRGSRNDSCGGYFGNHIIIDHQNGYASIYAHLELNTLQISSVGTHVSKTQPLALIDSSGNSDGDHLHFEVRYNGTAIDPNSLPLSNCSAYSCADTAQAASDFAVAQLGKEFSSESNIGTIDSPSFDAAGLIGSAWYHATGHDRYYHSYIPSFENNGDITVYHPNNILNEIKPGDAVFGGEYYGTQSTNTDYQHIGLFVGQISYNGINYQNAVIEASGYEGKIIVKEFDDGPWDDSIFARMIDCQI